MLNTMMELVAIGEKLGAVSNVKFSEKPETGYSWDTDRVIVSGIKSDGRKFELRLTVIEPKAEGDTDAD